MGKVEIYRPSETEIRFWISYEHHLMQALSQSLARRVEASECTRTQLRATCFYNLSLTMQSIFSFGDLCVPKLNVLLGLSLSVQRHVMFQ